jgi:hypothetical protein
MALQNPPDDYERASAKYRPLFSRTDPKSSRCHLAQKGFGSVEAPSAQAELRARRHVADELRNMKGHDRPEELAAAMPRIPQATGVHGLHHDDRPSAHTSRFRQNGGWFVRVGEHEEQQRRGKRSRFKRQNSIRDQHGRPAHHMHVGHVDADHLESQLALQQRREVAGPRAEVEQWTVVR